jgi:transcriptional regulator with XRE-family HTH domain
MASDFDFEALAAEIHRSQDARAGFVENRLRRRLAKSFEQARRARGLSVRELAKEIGTSISQVQRLLHHERGGGLTLRTICRAADALGLSVECHARQSGGNDGRTQLSSGTLLQRPIPSGLPAVPQFERAGGAATLHDELKLVVPDEKRGLAA